MLMNEQNSNAKKGKPTPARKQQEAARKRPLVTPKTKEARQAERAALRARRLEAQKGLANGDPKYLTKRDSGPQRSLLRDVVDSRFLTAGEVLMVFMVVTLFFTYTSTKITPLTLALSDAVLLLFVVYLIDTVLIFLKAKKVATRKFGAGNLQRGIWFYVAVRSMYPRFMRTPKAKVRRGHKFD
jgi:Flp pilus assembly protein TadB